MPAVGILNRKRVQTPQTNAKWYHHSPRLFVGAKGTQGQGRNAEIRPRAVAVCAHAAGHVLPCECAAPVGPNHADRVAAARLCGVRGWRSCRRAASPPSGQPRSSRDDANTTDATTRQPKRKEAQLGGVWCTAPVQPKHTDRGFSAPRRVACAGAALVVAPRRRYRANRGEQTRRREYSRRRQDNQRRAAGWCAAPVEPNGPAITARSCGARGRHSRYRIAFWTSGTSKARKGTTARLQRA